VLILVFGGQRAHMSIVKTAVTFGMDIARVDGEAFRGSIGMLGTIPLMLMDLADRLIPYPIPHPAALVRLAC